MPGIGNLIQFLGLNETQCNKCVNADDGSFFSCRRQSSILWRQLPQRLDFVGLENGLFVGSNLQVMRRKHHQHRHRSIRSTVTGITLKLPAECLTH